MLIIWRWYSVLLPLSVVYLYMQTWHFKSSLSAELARQDHKLNHLIQAISVEHKRDVNEVKRAAPFSASVSLSSSPVSSDHVHHEIDGFVYAESGLFVDNKTFIEENLERLKILDGLEGTELRDYTLQSHGYFSGAGMKAIMYPPNVKEDINSCLQVNTAKDNLERYLKRCKKDDFLVDMCSVVEMYLIKDPLWKSSSSDKRRWFLEVGALNGAEKNSMTYVLEKYMANIWQGITVEATPANFVALHKNRPCTYRTEVALSTEWRWIDFIGWGGCCSGHSEAMNDNFKKTFHGKTPKSYKVLSAPITDVVKAIPSMKSSGAWIDFLSLDVEGAEYFVLDGMRPSEVPVKLILMEAVQWPKNSAGNVTEKLLELGYVKDTYFKSAGDLNELWIHMEHAEDWMLDAFSSLQNS